MPHAQTPHRAFHPPPTPFEDLSVVWTFPPDQHHRAPVLAEFLASRNVDAALGGSGEVWVPALQAEFGTLCARSFMRDYDRSLAEMLAENDRADGTARSRWLFALVPLFLLTILGIGLYDEWTNPYRRFNAEDAAIVAVLVGGPVALVVLWRWKNRRT